MPIAIVLVKMNTDSELTTKTQPTMLYLLKTTIKRLSFSAFALPTVSIWVGVMMLISIGAVSQTTTENYVKTTVYTSGGGVLGGPAPKVSVQYYDGLGRPKQTVLQAEGGNGEDLITHIAYDELGMQLQEFLPFARSSSSLNYDTDAYNEILNFYNGSGFGTTANPYSETEYFHSPLHRVSKQAAPGDDWAIDSGHEVKFDYKGNQATEVHQFSVSNALSTTPGLVYDGPYAADELTVTTTYDENNTTNAVPGSIKEYKDKNGRVVLKRQNTTTSGRTQDPTPLGAVFIDTYYVYDDFGNLTFVLSPKCSEQIVQGSGLAGNYDALLDALGYRYAYDSRNRLTRKKLPGKQAENILYNSYDQPIAVGPVLSPFGTGDLGFLHTKYDRLGRVAYTFWKQGPTVGDLPDGFANANTVQYETQTETNTIGGVTFGYTNAIAPTFGYQILTVHYYDNYSWPGAPTSIPPTVGTGDSPVHYNNTTHKPLGLPTGGWVRTLETETDTNGNTNYLLYDQKGRVVRAHTGFEQGGYTQVDSKYNFTGNVLYTMTKHLKANGSALQTVTDTYSYDNQLRVESHTQQINNEPVQLLAKNTYDALGRLTSKKVGGTDVSGNNAFQQVDYAYNLRGWLTAINDVDNLGPSGQPTDLFGFEINYLDAMSNNVNGQVVPLYNGNIAETSWRTSSDNVKRRYGYSYDYQNRLLDAWYQKPGDAVPLPQSYDEHLTYDYNGNIMTLDRNGSVEGAAPVIVIDDLDYAYDLGNKLLKVDDLVAHPEGFDDGNTGTIVDYSYDTFGNLVEDKNKGITKIEYNHLHLPTKVVFGTQGDIEYLYTADGAKIKKTVTEGTTIQTTTYRDGFQYHDGILDFFPQAEGEVQVTQGQYGLVAYNYVFHYTDHLGNIRVRYAEDPDDGVLKILEEKHYYPYGLQHTGYNNSRKSFKIDTSNSIDLTPVNPFLGDTYKYGYNGVEFNNDLGLNLHEMDLRLYDPAIGRFNGFDSVTHHAQGTSVAFDNNPVFWADPSGADAFAGGRDGSLINYGGPDSESYTDFDVSYGSAGTENTSEDNSSNQDEKDKPIQASDPGRQDLPDNEGGCSDSDVNCHSYTWHNSKGDPSDLRNALAPSDKWDNNPDDDTGGWREMDFNEANMPGDRILYYLYNPHTKKNEITHSATVISVDEEGNTLRVKSKFGSGQAKTHHPRDILGIYGKPTPTYVAYDGNTYISRQYFRKKSIDRKNAKNAKKNRPLIKSY